MSKDTYQDNHFVQLERLLTVWERLEQGERNIFLVLGNRILAGQRLHGPLTRDKKDWPYEALEEHLDSCVYMACALEASSAKAYEHSIRNEENEVLQAAQSIGLLKGCSPELDVT